MRRIIFALGLMVSSFAFAAEVDCIDLRLNGGLAGNYQVIETYSGQVMDLGEVKLTKSEYSMGYRASGRALRGERGMDICDGPNETTCSFGIFTPATLAWDFYLFKLLAEGDFTLTSMTGPRSLEFKRIKKP